MSNTVNLDEMSIEQCKALAYDLIAQREKVQSDLNMVNNAISRKANELTNKVAEIVKEDETK